MRTVGVEEEFLLVNPAGRPIGVAGVAADGEAVELELMEQMLETGTVPCLTAAELATKPFTPLPVLGVPGWWPANQDPAFYDDATVFRPPRSAFAPTT